jgi:hypothetical protein
MYSKDTQLSQDQLFSITKGAFAPYTCTPEFQDYKADFCFSVIDLDTKKHFKSEILKTVAASNASRLEISINSVRNQIERSGLSLDPWVFPEV